MGITIGTDQDANLPLSLRFRFNGTDVSWGQPYRINSFSNSAEAIDGKYRISDLDVYFLDPQGSIFATAFGNGTAGFGTSCQVVAYLGGTMEYVVHGHATVWEQIGTAGAVAATIHTGNVHGISYSDRLLRIRSKSKLGQLSNLKWQFPVPGLGIGVQWLGTIYGSYGFMPGNVYAGTKWIKSGYFDVDNNETRWKQYAYLGPSNIATVYPPLGGRGTPTTLNSLNEEPYTNYPVWYFPGTDAGGTNFYDVNTPVKFEATYLGTYDGTIETDSQAREYGFSSLLHANAAKSGSVYPLDRTRFKRTSGTFDVATTYLHTMGSLRIDGSPKEVYQLCMTGACVTPLFGTSDLDTTTLDQTGTITAYSYYVRLVDFEEDGAFDSIRELLQSTHALFCVNANNKFEYRAYGPLNLTQVIPSWDSGSLIHSSIENYEEDFYTRFIINYNYDNFNKVFLSTQEVKASNWSALIDRPLIINTKWIYNDNEANVLLQRTKLRYANSLPHVILETNLNKIGFDLGSLITVTELNGGINNKVVQITGFEKRWQDRKITFSGLDAEALFQRRGYAFWEGDSSLTNAVSGTSTSGWGTAGTVNNINGTIYGSMFVWW